METANTQTSNRSGMRVRASEYALENLIQFQENPTIRKCDVRYECTNCGNVGHRVDFPDWVIDDVEKRAIAALEDSRGKLTTIPVSRKPCKRCQAEADAACSAALEESLENGWLNPKGESC